jgi:hypothetical protein
MKMKFVSASFIALILCSALSFIVLFSVGNVPAEIVVGVKKGDWIEYQVTYTGTPPEGHDVSWGRMEIKDVQGKSVIVLITVNYSKGTQEEVTATLNLETGQLGDGFIIPANLNSGDTFLDKNVGNVTINGVKERTFAGATRTVVYAEILESKYYWDKATGILVEGTVQSPEYTMNTAVDKTNIWQPQILGLNPTVFYVTIIGATVLIVVALAVVITRRKK